jgi:hypothetical protein
MWDLWWAKWRRGRVFSENFRLPCQFSFYQLLHTHQLSSWAGTIDQLVVGVPSGLSLTPHQETLKKILTRSVEEWLRLLIVFTAKQCLGTSHRTPG